VARPQSLLRHPAADLSLTKQRRSWGFEDRRMLLMRRNLFPAVDEERLQELIMKWSSRFFKVLGLFSNCLFHQSSAWR
jgi:hypothetical protein